MCTHEKEKDTGVVIWLMAWSKLDVIWNREPMARDTPERAGRLLADCSTCYMIDKVHPTQSSQPFLKWVLVPKGVIVKINVDATVRKERGLVGVRGCKRQEWHGTCYLFYPDPRFFHAPYRWVFSSQGGDSVGCKMWISKMGHWVGCDQYCE